MAKVLIADDESDIRSLIRRYGELEGYEFREASDGATAVELCKDENFDAIIMDIMMPGMDGYTACREIRKLKDIPVLMLSARGSEIDKLYGFELGIDDYVVKPFSPKELIARLKVILSRHHAQNSQRQEILAIGKMEINKAGHTVSINGEPIGLTTKEYELLLYLAENRGIVLSREQILNAVWGYDYIGEDRTVDWQIKLLRGKLGECREWIKTLRGVGYKFEA